MTIPTKKAWIVFYRQHHSGTWSMVKINAVDRDAAAETVARQQGMIGTNGLMVVKASKITVIDVTVETIASSVSRTIGPEEGI